MESELITPSHFFYAKIYSYLRDIIWAFKMVMKTLPPLHLFNLVPTLMHSHAHKQKSVHVTENTFHLHLIEFNYICLQIKWS